eukprot:1158904-Pelagomonas_calceolata.AAC.3
MRLSAKLRRSSNTHAKYTCAYTCAYEEAHAPNAHTHVRTHLVERDDEGCLAHAEHVDALYRLLLQAVHEVHAQYSNVAQTRATGAQVGEGLVAGRVDHEQTCRQERWGDNNWRLTNQCLVKEIGDRNGA